MKHYKLIFLVIIAILMASCTRTINSYFKLGPMEYRVEVQSDVMVPMADGVHLATDLYKPAGLDKAPVVLIRTPYGKEGTVSDPTGLLVKVVAKVLVGHGYIVAIQDCRGRYKSEGEFFPFLDETRDGHDAVKWMATQPWSTGKIGTWGGSYFGYTQWALADGSPEAAALVPLLTCADISHTIYEGGAMNFNNMLNWATGNGGHEQVKVKGEDMKKGFTVLPLVDAEKTVTGGHIDFFDQAVTYKILSLMDKVDYSQRYKEVSAPALSICGWYDLFQKYEIEDTMTIHKEAKEPARSQSRIVIGPWGHGIITKAPVKFPGGGITNMGQFEQILKWYDANLRGNRDGVDSWPLYNVYVMGKDEWQGFNEWPPKAMKPARWFFHSAGKANTLAGDGKLSQEAPAGEKQDTFSYDPKNPVPTMGGPLLGTELGPKVQNEIEKREDVLVFSTEKLSAPLTIMGPMSVTLFAASDAKDTDFTAKICDVLPDGRSVNITDGIIRARFRSRDLFKPELIAPGQVYEYNIDLWYTAYQFQPGHQVRVEVSSSNFPRFDRNLNTGEEFGTNADMRTAKQTIYHDQEHPSSITLPVMP